MTNIKHVNDIYQEDLICRIIYFNIEGAVVWQVAKFSKKYYQKNQGGLGLLIRLVATTGSFISFLQLLFSMVSFNLIPSWLR